MTPDDLKLRSKRFALRCPKAAEALPRSVTGRTIAGQLARSGTSVAANYRAACRARSSAEFISKLGVVVEEADETMFWLELAIEATVLSAPKAAALLKEADELVAIFTASRISAQQKRTPNRQSAIGNRQ